MEELEEKAASYAASLAAGSEDAGERGEEFRTLCRWHMKKSGFRADEAETMDIEAEFFDGAEVRQTALDQAETFFPELGGMGERAQFLFPNAVASQHGWKSFHGK